VIDTVMESVRPAAEAKQVRLVLSTRRDTGPVLGDEHRLQQIVWNLLSNAIKFTPPGGQVHVSLRRVGQEAVVRVRDTGIGVEPEFLQRLFDRFSQRDPTSTRRHGGLGLGLAIVRELVALHGGTVVAESDGPGRGATFTVRLPLLAGAGGSVRPEAGEPETLDAGRLEGLRVLLVEDDPDGRELAERVLRGAGAHVSAVDSVDQALERVTGFRPHAIVSDLAMPGRDGYSFMRQVRESERLSALPAVPALALSGYARPEDRARALAAGYQRHLAKPFDLDELVSAVATLIHEASGTLSP
jgi:CheY-like chemotaxis protein